MKKDTQRLHIQGVVRRLNEDDDALTTRAAKVLGIASSDILNITLLKRSLDARGEPRFKCNVEVEVASGSLGKLPGNVSEAPDPGSLLARDFSPRRKERVVIIGAGPAGLFCAHRLSMFGVEPILLDRGQPVEIRGRHVSGLMHRGELLPDSNICFGEGGAGTWSDGKLYTRVRDVRVRHILETIVSLGGPKKILVDARPHLGTDKLVALCKAFRAELIEQGCQVRFGAFVKQLVFEDTASGRKVTGVRLRDGELIEADRVILAVGHSAREMYHHLAQENVFMEPKPFAVGFRVEHPQKLINDVRYGKWASNKSLPTADYRLTANFGKGDKHRGVYSFCMCPGGQVVPSATFEGGVCVNGMSHASRRGHWANSALVVSVRPEDFGSFGKIEGLGQYDGILDGMAFQEESERRAYDLGGGGYIAPASRLADFKQGIASKEVRKTTYKPGIAAAPLDSCYPEFVTKLLRNALGEFEKSLSGFVTNDALLIGVETRTSAPVRITREQDDLQSLSVRGLYPCGEGAGYGGGIVSAGLDGLRIAETILSELES